MYARAQMVIDAGVCRPLVKLLMHPSVAVQTPALRTVGNIVTGDDMQTQAIIAAGALGALTHLLRSTKRGIRKEACWTISNITAGNKEQIQAVIDANLVPWLREVMQKAEYDVRKEAVWAISNATAGGSPAQIHHFVEKGILPPLCEQLQLADSKILVVAMDGIENILKVGHAEMLSNGLPENPYAKIVETCGGADRLEQLQFHDTRDIYERAVKILRTYFDATEVKEDSGVAPVPIENQQVRAAARV
jgi:importin subunit alpha-1